MNKRIFLIVMSFLLLSIHSEAKKINVRWVTFNIRCDCSVDGQNSWSHRKDNVCRFIKDQQLDIVGMQEVLHNQLLDLHGGLPEYGSIGVGRADGKTQGEYAPLLYRKDKYEVLDSGTFWLSENPENMGVKGWDAACERIATWAKFKDKASGKIFMAVNTHFDHIGVEARRQSALLIIRKIREIVGERPAVITGDFNVDDQSDAYKTITTNEFVLLDAHKVAKNVTGVSHTYHDFARIPAQECKKIDFVFVTPQIKVKSSYIPQEDAQAPLSDHNPQITDLRF